MAVVRAESVDEYLRQIGSDEARTTLTRLRAIILDEAPDAEEVIRYGIPTYRLRGFLASFAAFKNHCSFFPGHTVRDFAEDLKGYKTAKGTVRFPHAEPLPEARVRAMIRARMAENGDGGAA